ncbi:hypothetical protein ACFSKM_27245 [Ancylobacter dichloromethanicus]
MTSACPSDPSAVPPPPAGGRTRARLLWVLAGLLVALLLAFLAGFAAFVAGMEGREAQAGRRADGIVVLTGGSERIVDATNLLLEGRGAATADHRRASRHHAQRDRAHRAGDTRGAGMLR